MQGLSRQPPHTPLRSSRHYQRYRARRQDHPRRSTESFGTYYRHFEAVTHSRRV
ncbi:hypothetical protein PLICRDRAFT_495381 [Plicaturopsis crispa FD-325 SS-3]|nr:hypothetical protein PLICRDRAFT_495381 [Plicaturopsis crispa FD-325 SS-3]